MIEIEKALKKRKPRKIAALLDFKRGYIRALFLEMVEG